MNKSDLEALYRAFAEAANAVNPIQQQYQQWQQTGLTGMTFSTEDWERRCIVCDVLERIAGAFKAASKEIPDIRSV